MIKILTQQNPILLNNRIIAGEQYSYLPDTPTQSGNAGMFGLPQQPTGQPYGVLAPTTDNQGGFNIQNALSLLTQGQGGGQGGQQGGMQGADKTLDTIKSLIPVASQLLQKRPLSEVEGVCGKRPSFLASKSKKAAWQKCANTYAKNMAQKQTQPIMQQTKDDDGGKKMSMTTKIALGVGGVAILGAVIYFATRNKTGK